MEDQKREFKGIWIPAEIWLDERLNALDKVIFAEIDSFSSSGRVCFKSNSVLAEFCQCSESKVSKTVSKLIDLGYIKCVSFDGRKRFLQSCLVNFTMQNSKIYESAEQILQDSNTVNNSFNNIFNNTPYNLPTVGQKELSKKESNDSSDSEYCKMVASSYNSICKNLVKVQKITEKRKRAIKKAKKDIEEFGGWEKYFEKINESDYLNGKVTNWKADFDWLLKPEKMIKIMEGSYQNNVAKEKSNIPDKSDYDEGIFFEGVK